MKLIKEAALIFAVTMAGELLYTILPFPVPAGVYGLFLLLFLLLSGLIKVEQIERAGNFLLEIMAMLFIPAMAGILESKDLLARVAVPYMVIILATTAFVMAVTGNAADFIIRRKEEKEAEK